MIDKIKNNITNHVGSRVKIVCKGSRNKKEQYNGIITEAYNNIFIVKLDNNDIKSLCYSDILIGIINISFY